MSKSTFTCTWCQKEFLRADRTRDHLTPKVLGGSDESDNLTDCCKPCNQERNVIQTFYARKLQILKKVAELPTRGNKFKGRLRCQIRDFRRNRPEMESLRDAWSRLETARLGRSYSHLLDFTIPMVKFRYSKPRGPLGLLEIDATVVGEL